MGKKINKSMFLFTLFTLLPFFFLLLIGLIGSNFASIEWNEMIFSLFLTFNAAYLTGQYKIKLNILGCIGFNLIGIIFIIYPYIQRDQPMGPYQFSLYFGILNIIIGIVSFLINLQIYKTKS